MKEDSITIYLIFFKKDFDDIIMSFKNIIPTNREVKYIDKK